MNFEDESIVFCVQGARNSANKANIIAENWKILCISPKESVKTDTTNIQKACVIHITEKLTKKWVVFQLTT